MHRVRRLLSTIVAVALLWFGGLALAAPASAAQPWCNYGGTASVNYGGTTSYYDEPMTDQIGAYFRDDCFLKVGYHLDGVTALQKNLNACLLYTSDAADE